VYSNNIHQIRTDLSAAFNRRIIRWYWDGRLFDAGQITEKKMVFIKMKAKY